MIFFIFPHNTHSDKFIRRGTHIMSLSECLSMYIDIIYCCQPAVCIFKVFFNISQINKLWRALNSDKIWVSKNLRQWKAKSSKNISFPWPSANKLINVQDTAMRETSRTESPPHRKTCKTHEAHSYSKLYAFEHFFHTRHTTIFINHVFACLKDFCKCSCFKCFKNSKV